MTEELHVKIGEIMRGRPGQVLKSTFGSCVGIALLWHKEQRYVLAHCLLGEAPAGAPLAGGRYVSQAVPALIRKLKVPADRLGEVEAIVVGGGRMTDDSRSGGASIGELNIRSAQEHVGRVSFLRVRWDVGGDRATQIRIDCDSGEVTVRRVEINEGGGRVAS